MGAERMVESKEFKTIEEISGNKTTDWDWHYGVFHFYIDLTDFDLAIGLGWNKDSNRPQLNIGIGPFWFSIDWDKINVW